MKSVGETLRKEREGRGVSLQEISEETKISRRFLQAIEEEHFELLPGGIFNKNFIRQFARYLGLDEDTAVQDYLQIVGAEREPPEGEKYAPSLETQSAAATGYFRLVVAAICLGALMAVLAYGLYRLRERAAVSPPASQQMANTPAAASPQPSVPAVENADLAPPQISSDLPGPQPSLLPGSNIAGSAPKNSLGAAPSGTASSGGRVLESGIASPPSATELELRIDSLSPVWVSFTTDGGERWQGTLQRNQTKEVKASGSIHLTVGDAGAVDLSLNGNSLPPLGRSGEVKRITITSKGLEASP